MNKHYKTNKFSFISVFASNCKSIVLRKFRSEIYGGLSLALLSIFGFNSKAQVATYNIPLAQIIDCPNNCGTGSVYNNCGATNPGFFWNDTLPNGAIVDSIVVRLNIGVECGPGTRPTLLNNRPATAVTSPNWCNCTPQEYLQTSRPSPVDYIQRARNEFRLTSGNTCLGFSPNSSTLGGNYARVLVYFKTADIEAIDVKPVTNFSSMCKLSAYEVDLTLRNNGPGPGGVIDVEVTFPGAEKLVEKVNVSDLGVGQTKTYRLSKEYLIPSQLGSGLELKADVKSSDLDNSNNVVSKFWDVLSTPYGSEFVPSTGFPGFPRDGNRFNQDYITYNKTYRYNITPPALYTNNNFGSAWTADFTPLINGSPLPASKYTYTAPQGGNNAFVVFNLEESDLNSEVQLRFAVTDISGNGCDSTTVRYAVVMPTPKPLYDGVSVCEVDELQFVNKSSVASGLNSYRWDFGDGNGSTLFEPKHKFSAVGSYPVKLVATSNIGFADSITVNVEVNPSPVVDFTYTNQCGNNAIPFVNASTISNGTLNYLWEFGDGTESLLENPNKIYNVAGPYDVVLTAESDKGCINSTTKSAYSYPAPNVNFDVPSSVCAGDNVKLNNTTSIAFSNWGSEWSIGNSMRRTFVKDPTYIFREFGEQPVKLKITTQFGCVDSLTKMISISPGPAIDITHSDVCSSGPVVFNSNITVPQGMAVDYIWNIAGILYATSNPVVSFGASGTKNVNVEIAYANGCKNSASTQVLTGYRPNASFDVPEVVCSGEPMLISNNTTIEFGNPSNTWIMGDGAIYTGVFVPNHVYSNTTPEKYTITLISTSASGQCPDTVSHEVNVGIIPTCDFDIVETYLPGHRGYTFVPTQSGANYTWFYGDGRTSTNPSPVYQFERDGEFKVRLVVTTDEGCQCESSKLHSVYNLSTDLILAQNGFSIYPNPSNGIVKVGNAGNINVSSIKVVNVIGETIFSQLENSSKNEFVLDLSELANGVYLVKITTDDNRVLTQKIIISK